MDKRQGKTLFLYKNSFISIIKKFSEYNLGIDLGSSFVKIFAETKGILFFEPAVVARQKKKPRQILAVGKKARIMIGKEPKQIDLIEPVRHGVVADFDAALILSQYLFGLVRQTPGKWLKIFGPRVVTGVSSGATEVERRAVKALMLKNGAREVFLVEKPIAAAIGVDLPVESAAGNLIIDIGGETTEMAVVCSGGVVLSRCLPIGGRQMDEALISYLRLKHGILIGRLTGEKIRSGLAIVSPKAIVARRQMVARGRDLESGLPRSVRISSGEVMEAIMPQVQKIVLALNEMLEETPAELTDDILKRGIVLTGGVAQMPGWDQLIKERTKMPVLISKNPQESVARGCGELLNNQPLLKRVKLVTGLK